MKKKALVRGRKEKKIHTLRETFTKLSFSLFSSNWKCPKCTNERKTHTNFCIAVCLAYHHHLSGKLFGFSFKKFDKFACILFLSFLPSFIHKLTNSHVTCSSFEKSLNTCGCVWCVSACKKNTITTQPDFDMSENFKEQLYNWWLKFILFRWTLECMHAVYWSALNEILLRDCLCSLIEFDKRRMKGNN